MVLKVRVYRELADWFKTQILTVRGYNRCPQITQDFNSSWKKKPTTSDLNHRQQWNTRGVGESRHFGLWKAKSGVHQIKERVDQRHSALICKYILLFGSESNWVAASDMKRISTVSRKLLFKSILKASKYTVSDIVNKLPSFSWNRGTITSKEKKIEGMIWSSVRENNKIRV